MRAPVGPHPSPVLDRRYTISSGTRLDSMNQQSTDLCYRYGPGFQTSTHNRVSCCPTENGGPGQVLPLRCYRRDEHDARCTEAPRMASSIVEMMGATPGVRHHFKPGYLVEGGGRSFFPFLGSFRCRLQFRFFVSFRFFLFFRVFSCAFS